MNKLFILSISILSILFFNACNKDDDNEIDYGYEARIMSPTADDKKVGDEFHVHVNFESTTGEPVHNINVKIYNEADHSIMLYDGPEDAHVHATEGSYELHVEDMIALTEAKGVEGHSNWIVEAKVWPHGDNHEGEHNHEDEHNDHAVTEKLMFHVHPN